MLEAALKSDNAFVTLTYNDDTLPRCKPSTTQSSDGLPTLDPSHLQNFLKRLRWAIKPIKIRFYACGEYGDETFRPHYHVALFGFPTCLHGRTRERKGRPDWANCCPQCEMVGNQWRHGDVVLGTLETNSAQYLAGYVTKKMTRHDDPRLDGRYPEFARMSLRPGIGHDFLHDVASTMLTLNLEKTQPDVPSGLRHGSRTLPLGRYLRRKLRLLIGKEANAPQSEIEKYKAEMLPLLKAAILDPDNPSLKGQLIEKYKGKILSLEAKDKIFKQRKKI